MPEAGGPVLRSKLRRRGRLPPGDHRIVRLTPAGGVKEGQAGDDAVEVGDERRPQPFDVSAFTLQGAGEAIVVANGSEVGVEAVRPQQIDAGLAQGVVQTRGHTPFIGTSTPFDSASSSIRGDEF